MIRRFINPRLLGLALACYCWPFYAQATVLAIDVVAIQRDGHDLSLEGRVLITAKDNGLLFQTRDGALWPVLPEELVRRDQDDRPFTPFSSDDQAKHVLAQLPAGFEVYRTKNYVICHQSSKAYAHWCGALFERLYRGFQTYWTNRGLKLSEPEFPLVAVVFGDKASYANFAKRDKAEELVAYYHLHNNRVTLFDVTGISAVRGERDRRGSSAQINEILSRPEAEVNVANVIHEATHQLAFNRGLHRRLADIPLWVAEGLAVYFETPDLRSDKGWRTIGAVNRGRLTTFNRYQPDRPATSLESLVVDDKRFRDAKLALPAYAEAWALNHFLLTRRTKQYATYIKKLSEKDPLVWDTPKERLGEFRAAFGDDLRKLDAEFLKHVKQLR
jgi:hypothetical protein